MDNDTSEIEKLTERIAKDPKSKLFVPLAEEYKKAGDIEMAIQVLTDGLKSNPGYVTARSFLGRLLLDRGDIAGAQKELEEVIKAIPDNLLAQRKLGDIYVLQGRGRDALQRYKTALTLNPADKELPSLIADLDAGKDVSARIPRPKMTATASVQQAPTTPSQPKSAPAVTLKPAAPASAAPPTLQKAAPAAPIAPKTVIPPAAATPKTEAASASQVAPKKETAPAAPGMTKTEAAPAAPVPQRTEATPEAAASPAVHSGSATPAVPSRDEAEVVEDIVEIEHLDKPSFEGGVPPLDVPLKPDSSLPEAFEAPAFDLTDTPVTDATDAAGLADISWGSDTFSVPPIAAVEEPPAASDEGSDDLNTNTLAELYISQGFYDKAIEVYQGMLGERPDNKSLQEKLEKLRALAGAADQQAAVSPAAVSSPPQEPAPAAAPVVPEPQPPVEAPVPPPAEASRQAAVASQPEGQTGVEAALEKVIREAEPENQAGRGPRVATARRKETIDRLESWLTNIMKEKK